MGHIWIVFRDRFRTGLALERGNSLPEVVEHRVRGRVSIMGSPVRFSPGDHVDPGYLLIDDRRLHDPVLRIRHILGEQLAHRDEPIERFIPARDAIRADHGGRVFRVMRHQLRL